VINSAAKGMALGRSNAYCVPVPGLPGRRLYCVVFSLFDLRSESGVTGG
jgi:hypothetical protein